MKAKVGLALAFLLVSAFVMPTLVARTNAITGHGLLGAYYVGTFLGPSNPLPAFPGCGSSYSTPPAESGPPTTVTVDPNINFGAPTGFYWMESPPGSGFSVNGITFVNTEFSVQWTGYINIATAGSYTFGLNSDDGSWLYIDGSLVTSDSGTHPPGAPITAPAVTGTVSLSAGSHTIEVDYYETCDTQSGIDLYWTPPETPGPAIVPTDVLTPAAIGSNSGIQTPEFPLGVLLVLAVLFPALMILKQRSTRLMPK